MSLSAISGAEPWIGAYRPQEVTPSLDADRYGDYEGFIREDFSEHIFRDNHIKPGWIFHDLYGQHIS